MNRYGANCPFKGAAAQLGRWNRFRACEVSGGLRHRAEGRLLGQNYIRPLHHHACRTMTLQSITNKDVGALPVAKPDLSAPILDRFSLKGKVATVTGSSKGIGYAVAEAYAQAGADVAIWYNLTPADDKAKALADKYGVRLKAYHCNITDDQHVKQVTEQIAKDFGTIDIFVANAGVAWTKGPCCDLAEGVAEWKKVIDADLNAVYYCARAVAPIFKQHKQGRFIITASMLGHIVNVPQLQAPYNAAKAATHMFAKSLAVEWAGFARVNSVSPGYVDTELSKFVDPETHNLWLQLIPLGRECDVRELVGAYVYLALDASSYTTGADIRVDGAYTCP